MAEHLMTGPLGNSEFCFPSTSVRVYGKQNSLFSSGAVIKCLKLGVIGKRESLYLKPSGPSGRCLSWVSVA